MPKKIVKNLSYLDGSLHPAHDLLRALNDEGQSTSIVLGQTGPFGIDAAEQVFQVRFRNLRRMDKMNRGINDFTFIRSNEGAIPASRSDSHSTHY